MCDYPGSIGLQRITREIWERGGIVGAVCHGYCGLLNTRLADGRLITGQNPGSARATAKAIVALPEA